MIISIFTALAAIASCIISAFDLYSTNQLTKYTVQATHDLESEKLFFNAKAEAYHTFLHSASNFMANPSAENSLKLNTDCTYSVLFSSQKTQNAISAYGKSLVRYQSDPKSEALTAEMVHAQVTAMHAMQEELSTTMCSKVPQ